MWVLESKKNDLEKKFYLLCGEPLEVGRVSGVPISLTNDKSISREHALLTLVHLQENLTNIHIYPEVRLKDLSSKYGTYVNDGILENKRIESNVSISLKRGDKIRFGMLHNTWQLKYYPMVVTSSQLIAKRKLVDDMLLLGGHIAKEWTNGCSYLVMSELRLTAKTVCAMADATFIVTPAFISDMVDAVRHKSPLPDPNKYLPPLKEPSINGTLASFSPDPLRKKLFEGKTFLFQTASSYKRMHLAVTLGGGVAQELTDSNHPKLIKDNVLLIRASDKERNILPSCASTALALLKENNLNVIPESDIGLAFVYRSLEKYCNPHFKINNILRPSSQARGPSESLVIYATETQNEVMTPVKSYPSIPLSRTTIVESGESTKTKSSSLRSKESVDVKRMTQQSKSSIDDTLFESSSRDQLNADGKENLSRQKRERLNEDQSDDCRPPMKRQNRVTEITKSVIDDTETMDFGSPVEFCPGVHSTEKDSPIKKEPVLRKNNIRITNRVVLTSDRPNDCRLSLDSLAMPAPLTLPSLRFDDIPAATEEPHPAPPSLFMDNSLSSLDFTPVIKTEIPDESIDGLTGLNRSTNDKEPDSSLRIVLETPESSGSSCSVNKKALKNPFDIPIVTQSRRRKRQDSDELLSESKRSKVKEPVPLAEKNNNRPSTSNIPIERSVSDFKNIVPQPHEQLQVSNDSVNNNRFISKDDSICGVEVKREDSSADGFSKRFEKSLVVVEVVSLVKPLSRRNCNFSVNSTASSSNGLPNFKRFKKATSLSGTNTTETDVVSILPRIIGGIDLVAHTELNNRKDDFFASYHHENTQNSAEISLSDRRANENFDAAFTLPNPGGRRGVRFR